MEKQNSGIFALCLRDLTHSDGTQCFSSGKYYEIIKCHDNDLELRNNQAYSHFVDLDSSVGSWRKYFTVVDKKCSTRLDQQEQHLKLIQSLQDDKHELVKFIKTVLDDCLVPDYDMGVPVESDLQKEAKQLIQKHSK